MRLFFNLYQNLEANILEANKKVHYLQANEANKNIRSLIRRLNHFMSFMYRALAFIPVHACVKQLIYELGIMEHNLLAALNQSD